MPGRPRPARGPAGAGARRAARRPRARRARGLDLLRRLRARRRRPARRARGRDPLALRGAARRSASRPCASTPTCSTSTRAPCSPRPAPRPGIDLCLHLVRRDHGAEVANRVARRMVVAAHRDGGQAQFIERPGRRARRRDDPVGRAMEHALARLGEPLAVADLARSAHLSPRQLERRFRAATGTSPGRWLIGQRVQASLPMLESGAASVEEWPARSASRRPATGATSAPGWGSARLRTGSGSARHDRHRADGRADGADRRGRRARRAARRRSGTPSPPGTRRAPRRAPACRARRRGSRRRARCPSWRDIVSTAAPVAKRAGGSDAAAALLRLGSVRPTPMPVRTRPGSSSLA